MKMKLHSYFLYLGRLKQENMNVLVEPEVHNVFARIPGFVFVQTFCSQNTSYIMQEVAFLCGKVDKYAFFSIMRL